MHMHSAATLNAGDDVIIVGSMKTQDSLNTQHVSYEGNNGSCTGNEGSDSCICQYRLHVGVHYSHVMTGTRVILDFQLGLIIRSGRIVTPPCSDNLILISQCSHCCISFATGL